MRAEEFLELLRRRPFTPLRIYLTDGTTYDIPHPDFVWVLRTRIDIGVLADPKTGVLDHVEHVSLLHVVRVEPMQPASPVGFANN